MTPPSIWEVWVDGKRVEYDFMSESSAISDAIDKAPRAQVVTIQKCENNRIKQVAMFSNGKRIK